MKVGIFFNLFIVDGPFIDCHFIPWRMKLLTGGVIINCNSNNGRCA